LILSENNKLDQAEELRRRMDKHNTFKVELDALRLPSRSKTHAHSNKNIKLSFNFPLFKLISIFIIILLLSIIAYSYYSNNSSGVIKNKEKNLMSKELKSDKEKVEKDIKDNYVSTNQPLNVEVEKDKHTTPVSSKVETNKEEKTNTEIKTQVKTYDIVYHKVGVQETLYRISLKYYGSNKGVTTIMNWNGLKDESIKEGQILKIPIPTSAAK
jgi:LysM repeat protein